MSPSRPKTTDRLIPASSKAMTAQDTARMSAFSATAIVGSATMKIREAMPEMNCPIIALTRSSTSVCLAIPRARALLSARPEVALGLGEQAVERRRHLERTTHHAGAVALQPVAVRRVPAAGHDDDEVVGAGGDRPRVLGEAVARPLARVDLDPRRASGATQLLGRNPRVLPQELAHRGLRPSQRVHRLGHHSPAPPD